MSDPLDELRSFAPPVDDQPELLEHFRNNLMDLIERDAPTTPAQPDELHPRRTKRRWVVPVAAALVATTAAATFALTRSSSESTSLECPADGGGVSIIDAVTGDPIADCSDVWRRDEKSEPPVMVAYDNGDGGVAVLLADDPAPDGYAALDPGPHQNTALIELESSLAASATGLRSACFDEPGAREVVQAELDRLGLSDWSVTVDPTRPPDGAKACAYFITKPDEKEVQLIGFHIEDVAAAADPFAPFAAELNEQLATDCLEIDEAADLARTLADNTVVEFDDGAVVDLAKAADISTVEDPAAECTRATVNVTGAIYVTLRGPKR